MTSCRRNLVTLDFETEAVQSRPSYPPTPVGVAIKEPGEPARYLAWGHPSENNCSFQDAHNTLLRLRTNYKGFIAHNLKFDWEILVSKFGIEFPIPECHDTMILAFLYDHTQRNIDLKSLSTNLLNRPPAERDELKEWITTLVPEARRAKKQWGAYISQAPGGLVGRYAIADVEMAEALFHKLYDEVMNMGMKRAYERELRLIPILLENEQHGIRVDTEALERDVITGNETISKVDSWIRKYLSASPELNIDSNEQLANALESAGKVERWILTDKGKRSTTKDALRECLSDATLLSVLEYRGALANFTSTFMSPWLESAQANNGFVYFQWHSIRSDVAGGTRTGRLSSTPNIQNIPSVARHQEMMERLNIDWLPPLPLVRKYILPDNRRSVIFGRDFDGQELRVLAHYEDAAMAQLYNNDPGADIHQYGADKIREFTGKEFIRKKVKIMVFTVIYGGGIGTLAQRLDTDENTASTFRNALFKTFPGIKKLSKDLENRARGGHTIRSWGGRALRIEPEGFSKKYNRHMTFYYKLLNTLIQGSSADITKEAVVRYHERKKDSRLMFTVHDEIVCCAHKNDWEAEMQILKEVMNGIEIDVPMKSAGEVGMNWGEMEKTT